MTTVNQLVKQIKKSGVAYRIIAENSKGLSGPDDKGISVYLIDKIMSGTHTNLTVNSMEKILGALEKIKHDRIVNRAHRKPRLPRAPK